MCCIRINVPLNGFVIQVTFCRLFGTKPLLKWMLLFCQLNPKGQTIWINLQLFSYKIECENIVCKMWTIFSMPRSVYVLNRIIVGPTVLVHIYRKENRDQRIICRIFTLLNAKRSVNQSTFIGDFRLAPSQWETALLCNAVSHWLGASPESALIFPHRDR